MVSLKLFRRPTEARHSWQSLPPRGCGAAMASRQGSRCDSQLALRRSASVTAIGWVAAEASSRDPAAASPQARQSCWIVCPPQAKRPNPLAGAAVAAGARSLGVVRLAHSAGHCFPFKASSGRGPGPGPRARAQARLLSTPSYCQCAPRSDSDGAVVHSQRC